LEEDEMSKLYKIIGLDGKPIHGGTGRWHLPTDDAPGGWMPDVAGTIIACERGYHLVTQVGLFNWFKCPAAIYEAEGRGDHHSDDNAKTAFRSARLLRRVGVLTAPLLVIWAADCAERVLPLWKMWRPEDPTPRRAVDTARTGAAVRVADAVTCAADATDAADAAAKAAWAAEVAGTAGVAGVAWAAAWTAWAAAWTAKAAGAAKAADAVRAATRAATRAAEAAGAAGAAAKDAEQQWQVNRLFNLLELET
jgi:hypothetical protein